MSEPGEIRQAEAVRKGEGKVVEAEVVRESASSGEVERVTVRRIPGGMLFGRSAFEFGGDPALARKRLRDLQFKLWLWLLGFAAIAAGCFYGAFVTEVVIWAAMLLVGGAVCLFCVSFLWMIIWAVRRIPMP